MYKRVFLIVIDSVGCGELPDAHLFGDVGANTIKHIDFETLKMVYLDFNGIFKINLTY